MGRLWIYAGIVVLALVWIWLAAYVFIKNGVTLLNIGWVAISGVIVFVPLYKKYLRKPD